MCVCVCGRVYVFMRAFSPCVEMTVMEYYDDNHGVTYLVDGLTNDKCRRLFPGPSSVSESSSVVHCKTAVVVLCTSC